MESTILGVVLVAVGAITLVRNVRMLRDPSALARYVETSPKAALWRNKLGVEKTVDLSRRIFLPLGSLVSLVLIGAGLASFLGN